MRPFRSVGWISVSIVGAVGYLWVASRLPAALLFAGVYTALPGCSSELWPRGGSKERGKGGAVPELRRSLSGICGGNEAAICGSSEMWRTPKILGEAPTTCPPPAPPPLFPVPSSSPMEQSAAKSGVLQRGRMGCWNFGVPILGRNGEFWGEKGGNRGVRASDRGEVGRTAGEELPGVTLWDLGAKKRAFGAWGRLRILGR